MWQGLHYSISIRTVKFFRLRLLSLDNESISRMLEDFDRDSKALKKSIYKLCWGMRGGVTLDEAYQLSYQDREIIFKIIEENIKTTNETGLPYF